jgi:serine/threonine protein phosphatase PrpC
LTRLIDDQELLRELASGIPAEAAERLLETSLARGAPDNVTMIIVKLT